MRWPLLSIACVIAACAGAPSLREEDFLRVTQGMSQPEVRSALGGPQRTEAFARTRQEAWDYAFTDAWGYFAVMSVIFDDQGRVIGKRHTRVEPHDS
jgi:outer membrane protein assembly factor BamE (lipoprotein component of BamABCDE complex)